MKNIKTFESFIKGNFVNESQELENFDDNFLSIILESEIEDEIKNLKDLDEESLEELNNLLEELNYYDSVLEDESFLLFEADDEISSQERGDLADAKAKGARSGAKKVVNAIGWLAFPYISILRFIYKTTAKKLAIRRILKKETDPIKKAKLRAQLKDMNRNQVQAYEKIKKMREKAAQKKEQIEDSGKVKEMPTAKKEELVKQAEKQKEEAKKLRDEIEKTKEEASKL